MDKSIPHLKQLIEILDGVQRIINTFTKLRLRKKFKLLRDWKFFNFIKQIIRNVKGVEACVRSGLQKHRCGQERSASERSTGHFVWSYGRFVAKVQTILAQRLCSSIKYLGEIVIHI